MISNNFKLMAYPTSGEPRDLLVETMVFPGGEEGVTLRGEASWPIIRHDDLVTIRARIQSSRELVQLLLILNTLKRIVRLPLTGAWQKRKAQVILWLTYLPYARRDRFEGVQATGDPICTALSVADFGSDMIATALNSYADVIDEVVLFDPHSEASHNKIANARVLAKTDLFWNTQLTRDKVPLALVAPDSGSLKSVEAFASRIGAAEVIIGTKHRDIRTGALSKIALHSPYTAASPFSGNVAVVDDICDGGGTFLPIANQIHCTGQKTLCVTHGIFSRGFVDLLAHYDAILTTDTWQSEEAMSKLPGYDATRITVRTYFNRPTKVPCFV